MLDINLRKIISKYFVVVDQFSTPTPILGVIVAVFDQVLFLLRLIKSLIIRNAFINLIFMFELLVMILGKFCNYYSFMRYMQKILPSFKVLLIHTPGLISLQD